MKAGIWLRISSNRGDEQSQLPDCLAHCEARGHEVARTYVVHGESAYHGEQDPDWSKVVADIGAGDIQVVVIWKVDRLDRRNLLVAVPMVNRALDAGARVEFASQPFIDLTTMPGRIAFAMFCELAHEESKVKSDRVKAKQAGLRANGSFAAGRVPFGYSLERRDGRKVLVPNQDADAVRRVFKMIAGGSTLLEAARTLDGKVWSENSVRTIIRNPAYRGLVQQGGRITYAACEPIVPAADWLKANEALAARGGKPGRGGGRKNTAFLWPVCGRCGGRFYRHGPTIMRCYGVGPNGNSTQRRGCGNTIEREALDAEVWQAFADADDAEIIETVIPGRDYAEEMAAVELALRDLSIRNPDYRAKRDALEAEFERLQALPVEPERRTSVATGRTEGEAFQVMTRDEQRDFIKQWTLTIWPKDSDDERALAAALMGRRWTLTRKP